MGFIPADFPFKTFGTLFLFWEIKGANIMNDTRENQVTYLFKC